MSELFLQAFSEENIKEAMLYLSKKKDSCGVDGIYLSELPDYWAKCGSTVAEQLQNGTYETQMVEEYELLTKRGKKRYINKLSSVDRLLTRALAQQLQKKYNQRFSQFSYAYQEGKSTYLAALQAAEYMKEGYMWAAELDVEKYFDSISLECLEMTMQELIEEDDVMLEEQGIVFVRFGDDITLWAKSRSEADQVMEFAKEQLEGRFHLQVNREKTRIYPAEKCELLGFVFERKKNGDIEVKRKIPEFSFYYQNWNTTALCKIDRNYHLVNKGILSRKDYTLLFENENQKKYLPVECVDTLGVYSNITFQSEVMRYLSEKKIRMVIFDRYGNHVGTFLPANMRNTYMKTAENQIRCYFAEEKRVDIARRIIIAGIHNMRSNLRYYYGRNHSSELGGIILELTDAIEAMTKAVSVPELLVIEARARQRYYHGFNGILHGEEFRFTKRTKRPPKDELNALISFGNTWMYQRIATEIYKTGLDIRFGFLHAATKRPESLNLDLAEIFKPVIVDRCIFTMINKGIIKKHHFEVVENGGIYLNREGKSLFIQTLENKLYQKIRLGNRQYTYYTVMKNDISKLILHINEEVNYKPYKHSN